MPTEPRTPGDLGHLLVPLTLTWRDALRRMDDSARGILLAVDATGVLQRTVTDGDLRRATLAALPDAVTLAALPAVPPRVVREDAGMEEVRRLIDTHGIRHVPVVDAAGHPVDLIDSQELASRIWLSSPHLGEEETAFVAEAFRSNWIAPLGPHVDGFERELAALVEVPHAAALSSGTAAIHLGLILLDVRPGDTVFCSSLTFVASCNPIRYCGALPVFIDSEPATWNMSPAALERALDEAARAGRLPRCVIVVNLYGQSADMDALLPVCARHGVPVLEDAAESLGALYKGRPSGGFGALSTYSFNGNKIITTSGGGMLVGRDAQLIAHARKLSTQARDPAPHYEHTEIGFNYRMSNVLAGIGRGQLRVLAQRVERRRRIFEIYRDALADVARIRWMPEPEGWRSTRWLSCFVLDGVDAQAERDRILRGLERHAIEARPVWKPMHLQPLYQGAPYFPHAPGDDVAARLFDAGVCLPSGSNMSDADLDRVIDRLRRVLRRAG